MVIPMKANVDYYIFQVTWSDEDQQFIGTCVEFPSLSWLASKPEAALDGIRTAVGNTLADMEQRDETIPRPISKRISEKILNRAIQVMGKRSLAESWFNTSVMALGGKTPLEFLATEGGDEEVLAVLVRIEHGVIS